MTAVLTYPVTVSLDPPDPTIATSVRRLSLFRLWRTPEAHTMT
jgi:hypothetical protein